jgi:hypothetical protein
MSHQYEMLERILDSLRKEAPESYKTYFPIKENLEGLNKARSLAFIHLLLKVKFGVFEFLDRHKLITDGTQDGGLDAYFIDEERKKLFLIQSKFRNTPENFEDKKIYANDLIKMEVSRITKGYPDDSRGVPFNEKIKSFQESLRNIRDIAKYDFIVFFLGNVYNYSDEQIRRIIDNCNYEIYNADKAYEKLLFPLTTGTYYDPDEILISLELSQKESPRLKQLIDTDFGQFNVTAIFVPTFEIGRVMAKFKNAILKFNPRNFLSLQRRSVNEKIRNSILKKKKNNFAILNNGITVLCENVSISESTGKQNEGQLILTRPQILNGGQTAFTLCTIFEENLDKPHNPLTGKEVLLKIITPVSSSINVDSEFVELISNATNQQNEVSEADRRSNNDIQIRLQDLIFKQYGYFYERKTGEFHDGLQNNFINKNLVIDRFDFIKAYWAFLGEPAAARRTSEALTFKEETFFRILNDTNKFNDMFFAYLLFRRMVELESSAKKKTDTIKEYGYAIMYGKWALISSIGIIKPNIPKDLKGITDLVDIQLKERLKVWIQFDEFIQHKRKDTKYFAENRSNFELYYKVNILDEDVKEYFLK